MMLTRYAAGGAVAAAARAQKRRGTVLRHRPSGHARITPPGHIVSHATQTRSRQLEDAWIAGRQRTLVEAILAAPNLESVDCVVCPPFVYLAEVARLLRGAAVKFGAQNVCAEGHGAYTGEVSAAMLKDVGCQYVIVGHSERRALTAKTTYWLPASSPPRSHVT